MLRAVHFEINAEEPERAITLYTEVFGWKIDMKRSAPSATTVNAINTIDVPSVDDFVSRIIERNTFGVIEEDPSAQRELME